MEISTGERSNIIYYADRKLFQQSPAVTFSLNVVFLTSIRDTGTCDRNGTLVETGGGVRYMEGVIERTVKETHPWWRGSSGLVYTGVLADIVRVVGVITDDTPRDMQDSSYSILPEPGRDWIFPLTLSTPDGQLVRNMTYNIPSSFRRLPLKGAEEERWLEKLDFELRVLRMMRRLRGDVLVSDHYMARVDFLHQNPGLYGRLLNIHPAVTVEGHRFCFRGKTPTADAIARARSDRLTQIQTGATLHFMGKEIDKGQPVAYVADTPVFLDDEPQWLRYRNYNLCKLPLFIRGLDHYARAIYPYLDALKNLDSHFPHPLLTKIVGNGDREGPDR